MGFCNKTAHPVASISIDATTDLVAHRFISYSGAFADGTVKALGVSELDWNDGDKAAVTVLGVMPVEASAAISKGDDITATMLGRAQTATEGDIINGRALDSAAALGDYVRVLLVQ